MGRAVRPGTSASRGFVDHDRPWTRLTGAVETLAGNRFVDAVPTYRGCGRAF